MKKIFAVLFFALICTTSAFAAKDDSNDFKSGDLGLTFYTGIPLFAVENLQTTNAASTYRYLGVGLDYHITSLFALEPGLFFMNTSEKTTDENSGETESDDDLLLGTSLGMFFYKNIKKNMNIYAGPRFEFGYTKSKEEDSSGNIEDSKKFDAGITAVFGLKYMFSSNFGVFGDIGLGYYYTYRERKIKGSSPEEDTYKTHTISFSKALFGVAFYF